MEGVAVVGLIDVEIDIGVEVDGRGAGSVPMESRALTSSQAYFDEVLAPNRDAYFDGPVSFATAFNFATSLFHFHDWLWVEFRPKLEARFDASFPSEKAFWDEVEVIHRDFGYIKDVANASKHMKLTRKTPTGVKHVSQAPLQSVGFGMGAYGVGRYSGPNFVVLDRDRTVSFDDCASAMFGYWRELLDALAEGPGS